MKTLKKIETIMAPMVLMSSLVMSVVACVLGFYAVAFPWTLVFAWSGLYYYNRLK